MLHYLILLFALADWQWCRESPLIQNGTFLIQNGTFEARPNARVTKMVAFDAFGQQNLEDEDEEDAQYKNFMTLTPSISVEGTQTGGVHIVSFAIVEHSGGAATSFGLVEGDVTGHFRDIENTTDACYLNFADGAIARKDGRMVDMEIVQRNSNLFNETIACDDGCVVVTMQADLDEGKFKIWLNGKAYASYDDIVEVNLHVKSQHSTIPGLVGECSILISLMWLVFLCVTLSQGGTFRWGLSAGWKDESVQIVPAPTLESWPDANLNLNAKGAQ